MILSDHEILQAVKWKTIIIDPFDKDNLGPSSYDIHLSNILFCYNNFALDVKKENKLSQIGFEEHGLLLQPNELYLGTTIESVESSRYMTFLDGKSSLARLGISVHLTAGRIDMGFKGHITLEITCVQPVRIYPCMSIGQLIYMESKGPIINRYQNRPSSKYKGINTEQSVNSKMYKEL